MVSGFDGGKGGSPADDPVEHSRGDGICLGQDDDLEDGEMVPVDDDVLTWEMFEVLGKVLCWGNLSPSFTNHHCCSELVFCLLWAKYSNFETFSTKSSLSNSSLNCSVLFWDDNGETAFGFGLKFKGDLRMSCIEETSATH